MISILTFDILDQLVDLGRQLDRCVSKARCSGKSLTYHLEIHRTRLFPQQCL